MTQVAASTYLNTIAPHTVTVPKKIGLNGTRAQRIAKKNELRRKRRHPATASDLSRSYIASMKAISQKATVKMDPTIKRTICQKCNTVLIPGATEECEYEVDPSRINPLHRPEPLTCCRTGSRVHGNLVTYTCTACSFVRRIPAPPDLDPDAPPDPATSIVAPAVRTEDIAETEDEAMVIDQSQPSTSSADPKQLQETKAARRPKRGGRKGPQPRLPPLFQRKGHVVFRGNSKLESDDAV
ncbi:RNAse P Rpr2/Rpp21/SNM1 subunit domain-containing protein [Fomitopsis serialis]|uniref:RNAse P Rpr2/Rpp21/SNM1 subunit domain-containing protein n=1 Tax=Fomitopsis serialis TaxID=139415 RepID=UPI0020089AC4|nr:RNAse P Rpr2/Rpp21/SNM1 subunit domain-containing protein [Neoantrodia serialis]KAH9935795.1 RNAse P Rpr2/Rpp21/SNM1 subunit domain-containing protein [Neoantrodia serialis]